MTDMDTARETDGYDWVADSVGSYADAIAEVGRRVAAGEEAPRDGKHFQPLPRPTNPLRARR